MTSSRSNLRQRIRIALNISVGIVVVFIGAWLILINQPEAATTQSVVTTATPPCVVTLDSERHFTQTSLGTFIWLNRENPDYDVIQCRPRITNFFADPEGPINSNITLSSRAETLVLYENIGYGSIHLLIEGLRLPFDQDLPKIYGGATIVAPNDSSTTPLEIIPDASSVAGLPLRFKFTYPKPLVGLNVMQNDLTFNLAKTAAEVPASYQCNDQIDNDADGLIDWPADPGCSDWQDTDESNPSISTTGSAPICVGEQAINRLVWTTLPGASSIQIHRVPEGMFGTIPTVNNTPSSNKAFDPNEPETQPRIESLLATLEGTRTSYDDTTASPGTRYDYQVAVLTSSGTFTSRATITTNSNCAPVVPPGPTNVAPIAREDTVSVIRGDSVTIPVLANDSDADNNIDQNSLVLPSDLNEEEGSARVVLGNPSVIEYTADVPSSINEDILTYRICDTEGLCDTASVIITIEERTVVPITADVRLTTSKSSYALREQVDFTLVNNGPDCVSLPNSVPFTISRAGAVVFTPNAAQVTEQLCAGGEKNYYWTQEVDNGDITNPGEHTTTVNYLAGAEPQSVSATFQITDDVSPTLEAVVEVETTKEVFNVGEQVEFYILNRGPDCITINNTPFKILDGETVIFEPNLVSTPSPTLCANQRQDYYWTQELSAGGNASPGVFSATVNYNLGTEALSSSAAFSIIEGEEPQPAEFTCEPITGDAPLVVNCNYSGPNLDDTVWDMGNGTVINGGTASQTYTKPGGYVVSVRNGDFLGSEFIIVTDPNPVSPPSVDKTGGTPPIANLASTGGSLALTIISSLLLAGLVSYFIVRRPLSKNQE